MRNLALAAVMLGSATGGGLYLYLDAHDVFRPVDLSILEGRGGISVIFDTSASRLLESCSKNCSTPISLEEMGGFPKFAVAAEDKKFWERRGIISKRGTISAVVDWFRGHPIRGASTIQMQVARTLFATEEVARQREEGGTKNLFLRKAREWWVARNLNKTLSREKILELYLNTIHCGDNRDGIEEASQWFFGVSAKELSTYRPEDSITVRGEKIGHVADIAGSWRSPGVHPWKTRGAFLARRERVLGQFERAGLISEEERERAIGATLPSRRAAVKPYAPQFAEYLRKEIAKTRKFADEGIRVKTTLEPKIQRAATAALEDSMQKIVERNPDLAKDLCGATVVLRNDGAIVAWTQVSFAGKNDFNYVVQAKRQPGSAFKMFLYALLLRKGWRLSCDDAGTGPCMVLDAPVAVSMGNGKVHLVENFSGYKTTPRYRGPIELVIAFAESRNTPAVRLYVQATNLEEFLSFLAELGIESAARALRNPAALDRLGQGDTIVLGAIEVSPLEMARAMTAFTTGALVKPFGIESLYDPERGAEERMRRPEPKTIFTGTERLAVMRLMRAPVEMPHGTAEGLRDKARHYFPGDVAAKTGTSNFPNETKDSLDNWFVAATPSYVVVTWIGTDIPRPLKDTIDPKTGETIRETGGRNALPVASKVFWAIYGDGPYEEFPPETDPRKPFPHDLLRGRQE